MFKRILSIFILSLMMNTAYAGETTGSTFDFEAALAADGATVDSVIAAALEAGEDITAIVNALADSGQSADAITFAMVSAGADADSVVAAVSTKTGVTPEALATTLVEAKINYNARVATGEIAGETIQVDTTTTAPRASFTTASGSGSPLTTEQFINITSTS
jgi:hypothetical protein